MILSMDATVARAKNRRPAKEGWNTLFFGANRYSRKAGEREPSADELFPVAFLVEKDPHAVVQPHYHQAEQFQVVVGGGGKFGIHQVDGVAVHYSGPYSAYGPIVADDRGISWFTLRKAYDQGAQYMPAERAGLRDGRARFQHREATAEVPGVLAEADLARLAGPSTDAVLAQEQDGVGAWRHRLPPGASLTGPDPATGGGQFWLVLSGSLTEPETLGRNSCLFVAPTAAAVRPVAGPTGAEILCMQFPVRARH